MQVKRTFHELERRTTPYLLYCYLIDILIAAGILVVARMQIHGLGPAVMLDKVLLVAVMCCIFSTLGLRALIIAIVWRINKSLKRLRVNHASPQELEESMEVKLALFIRCLMVHKDFPTRLNENLWVSMIVFILLSFSGMTLLAISYILLSSVSVDAHVKMQKHTLKVYQHIIEALKVRKHKQVEYSYTTDSVIRN